MLKFIFAIVLAIGVCSAFAQQPGDLDSSFAVNGLLVLEAYSEVSDMAITSSGKILAIAVPFGMTSINTRIIQLHPDGSIDTTFASNGEYIISWLEHLFVQSDGRILCLTSMNNVGNVHRLLPDGTLDPSYVAPSLIMRITAAEIYPDDRLIIGGRYGSGRRIYRLGPDGDLDVSFGNEGLITMKTLVTMLKRSIVFALPQMGIAFMLPHVRVHYPFYLKRLLHYFT